jgi:hypothetical protein
MVACHYTDQSGPVGDAKPVPRLDDGTGII